MEKSEVKQIAEGYLNSNPTKDKIFVCSDGNCFWSKILAMNHAKTIRGEWFEHPEIIEVKEEIAEVKPKAKKTKK